MNNDNLKDFLLECHVATGNLDNLAQSLMRSIQAIEFETAGTHPDRELVKRLAEGIKDLTERIGDRLYTRHLNAVESKAQIEPFQIFKMPSTYTP